MKVLTEDMKKMLDEQLAYIATADKDGYPQVGPKESLKVLDDSHLYYAERTSKHAWANIQAGSSVAVAVVDWENQVGYRFEGKPEIQTSGELFDSFKKAPTAVIVIPVEHVYSLNHFDGTAGTEITDLEEK